MQAGANSCGVVTVRLFAAGSLDRKQVRVSKRSACRSRKSQGWDVKACSYYISCLRYLCEDAVLREAELSLMILNMITGQEVMG